MICNSSGSDLVKKMAVIREQKFNGTVPTLSLNSPMRDDM